MEKQMEKDNGVDKTKKEDIANERKEGGGEEVKEKMKSVNKILGEKIQLVSMYFCILLIL